MAQKNDDFNKFFNLDFKGKGHGTGGDGMDVSITKCKGSYTFAFRNKVYEKMGDHLVIAIKNDYMFFKADNQIGWKVGDSGRVADTKYMKVSLTGAKTQGLDVDAFIGDYKLHFMEPIGLYYITKNEDGRVKL